MPQHESSALGLLQVRGRASPRATTIGERAAPSAHPTIANCDVEWIHTFLVSLTLQGFPPLDAQRSLFLGRQLPPPRIQSLLVGLVGPLLLHFLHPIFLALRVFAFHLRPLLLRHAVVASHALLGLFGLEGLVVPIRFQTSHTFVVASTVHGLHVLDPIQGGILSLPIQFLFLFFLRGPLGPGSARSWHIRALAPTIGRHTRPPTHATFGTDWESVGSAEPGHDGPAVAARFAR